MNRTENISNNSARLTIALCGNPNSGKTTLFNVLTGSNQKVGNWPGVTVEQKTGFYKQDKGVAIVDTPGIYSLSPFTVDEQVAHDYLFGGKPDLIINIVDSTNLERNLFLTTQLAELDIPMVVALNMLDEAEQKGIHINTDKLQRRLGCAFFSISAAKNIGVDGLMKYCITQKPAQRIPLRYLARTESTLNAMMSTLNVPNKRWTAIKILERDKNFIKSVKTDISKAQSIADEYFRQNPSLSSTDIAEQRYAQIEKIVSDCRTLTVRNVKENARRITDKIDKIVLNKWLAFPIFALIMTIVFYVSVGGLGEWLSGLISERLTPFLQQTVSGWLKSANAPWLSSLVVDGIMAGVLSVASFVPQIMLLFGFIAILEASGYMSRIAFITDRLLNKIGLGGKSFVSMILGCGCTVPAIMATRTIKNIDERNATITLTPFMPCSAKMAIISFFTAKLLGGNAIVAVSFYFVSIVAVILGGLILKVLHRKKNSANDTFLMELPVYRMPAPLNIIKQMWERGKAFLIKAGTVIFTASVLLWLLQSFDWQLHMVDTDRSMLASIGKTIAPLFIPLGFGHWQFAVATLTGIAAKETVVTTLEILIPEGMLASYVSPLGAYCFVIYNLLTIPCVASISASFTEQGNAGNGLLSMVFQLSIAYAVTLVLYQAGSLAVKHTAIFIITVCCMAIVLVLCLCVRYLAKHKGCNYNCSHCPHRAECAKK